MEDLSLTGVRQMFYLVTPSESQFEHVKDVPDYVLKTIPLFTAFVLIEQLCRHLSGKGHKFPVNDGLTSIAQGVIMDMTKLISLSCEIGAYVWFYNKFNIVQLPWNSAWTWWICFFGVDMGYYWFHRSAHEVNIMWAGHQVHHSSEYYNLSTALRQSLMQQFSSWIFYLPLATFIPPSVFLAHIQFNLLYQFWIHVEFIGKLGPLEYVLNTPSHHRVHHGRNRYCIDKNYAGTLIIWDRMFGTFQAEEEEVVYGLTHPINTFNPFWIQFGHLIYIINLIRDTPGFEQKLAVLFKGPGWGPGKPRLGLIEDIPDVQAPQEQFNPSVPNWWKVYTFVHNLITIFGAQLVHARYSEFNQITVLLFVSFILISFTAFGAILENKPWGGLLEIFRCTLFILGSNYFTSPLVSSELTTYFIAMRMLELYFFASALIWTFHYIQNIRIVFARFAKSSKSD